MSCFSGNKKNMPYRVVSPFLFMFLTRKISLGNMVSCWEFISVQHVDGRELMILFDADTDTSPLIFVFV